MTSLVWNATGSRSFETGVDRGVLYTGGTGVVWNGLTTVKESPSGGVAVPFYLDGIKFLQLSSAEEFDATIDAFSAPAEFALLDGSASIYAGLFITQQPRKPFGFAYRTLIGNDVDAEQHGYKVHLVYNALAKPTSRVRNTMGSGSDAETFSWDITTVPPLITGYKPSAHIVINSLLANPTKLASAEAIMYGTDVVAPRQPSISELITLFGS